MRERIIFIGYSSWAEKVIVMKWKIPLIMGFGRYRYRSGEIYYGTYFSNGSLIIATGILI